MTKKNRLSALVSSLLLAGHWCSMVDPFCGLVSAEHHLAIQFGDGEGLNVENVQHLAKVGG